MQCDALANLIFQKMDLLFFSLALIKEYVTEIRMKKLRSEV